MSFSDNRPAIGVTPKGILINLPEMQTTYFPWGTGQYALFGPNGAGKTRVLDAVNSLFEGGKYDHEWDNEGRATCSIIVEAEIPPEEIPEWNSDWYFLVKYLNAAQGLDSTHQWGGGGVVEEAYRAHLSTLWGQLRWESESPVPRSPFDRQFHAANQRYFEVQRGPRGNVVVRPYFLQDVDHPELSSALHEQWAQGVEDGPDEFPLWFESFRLPDGSYMVGGWILNGGWTSLPVEVYSVADAFSAKIDGENPPLLHFARDQLSRMLERDEDYLDWSYRVSSSATQHLREAMATSLALELVVPDHAGLLAGRQVQWVARRLNRYGWTETLPFWKISAAERIWASLAIYRAVSELGGLRYTLLVIDEPERGLHRGGEARAMRWFGSRLVHPGMWLWCATHSPSMLAQSEVTPVATLPPRVSEYVSHDLVDLATLRALSSPDRALMTEMGLSPSDLLASRRGFLLVEGLHDEIVISSLLGDELREMMIDIIPLRGGKNLPRSVDTMVLFDFTDAHLFAILDSISNSEFDSAWTAAQQFLPDNPERATDSLIQTIGSAKREETKWLAEWLKRSIAKGRSDRVSPLGLSKLDIVEYLPVSQFVPGATSWEELRDEHGQQEGIKDFKQWLRRKKGAQFSEDTLLEACEKMDAIPEDFTSILSSMSTVIEAGSTGSSAD